MLTFSLFAQSQILETDVYLPEYWYLLTLQLIFCVDDFAKAQKKMKQAQVSSNVESDDETSRTRPRSLSERYPEEEWGSGMDGDGK